MIQYAPGVELNNANELMGLIKDAATLVLPLLGVLVGARLAGQSAEKNWLRQERLKMYVELVSRLEAVNALFSGKLHTERFKGGPVTKGSARHDEYKTVLQEFYDAFSPLTLTSMNLRILSPRHEHGLHSELSDAWIRMITLATHANTSVTQQQWDRCSKASAELVLRLVAESRRELAIPQKGTPKLRRLRL